jgi:hypothetical protein
VKKVISIGIALALLVMAVTPAITAAQYTEPDTYAKIPFAIVGNMFLLLEEVLVALTDGGLLPDTFSWLPDLMQPIGDFVTGPLGWTVDMLAWGLGGIGGTLFTELSAVLEGLGVDLGIDLAPVGDLLNSLACAMFAPFSPITGADWNPCGG